MPTKISLAVTAGADLARGRSTHVDAAALATALGLVARASGSDLDALFAIVRTSHAAVD